MQCWWSLLVAGPGRNVGKDSRYNQAITGSFLHNHVVTYLPSEPNSHIYQCEVYFRLRAHKEPQKPEQEVSTGETCQQATPEHNHVATGPV